jgi:hypothetical protein
MGVQEIGEPQLLRHVYGSSLTETVLRQRAAAVMCCHVVLANAARKVRTASRKENGEVGVLIVYK